MRHVVHNLKLVQLERDKRQIKADIAQLEHQLQAEVDPSIDEADPELTTQVITAALLENARRKMTEIERAITQAQSGGYGICESCNQPIPKERLEIYPQATLCVSCKQAREKPLWHRRLRAA